MKAGFLSGIRVPVFKYVARVRKHLVAGGVAPQATTQTKIAGRKF
jgi:hypothetical protein